MHSEDQLQSTCMLQFLSIDGARPQEVIVELDEGAQDFLGSLLLLDSSLRVIYLLLEDVQNTKYWEPSLRVRRVKELLDLGHLLEDMEKKAVVVVFEKHITAFLKNGLITDA